MGRRCGQLDREVVVPDWLFEGRWEVYGTLAVVALALLILWWFRDRKRHWLIGVGVVGVLALIYLLLDYAVETDREEIGRKLQEMSQAVKRQDLNAAFDSIADNFTFAGTDKRTLQERADAHIKSSTVSEVVIWDYEFDGLSDQTPPLANVSFKVKVKGNLGGTQEVMFFCRAEYQKDAAKGWRMRSVRLFNPINTDEPVDVHP
jgi:hypothetical protein